MIPFPAINASYLKQNEHVSTEIVSSLSFLLKDPRAYERLKSMFEQDDQGSLSVCLKVSEEFKLRSTENVQYSYDPQNREYRFVINPQLVDAILKQTDGIETNCPALKILLFISSLYERIEPKYENNVATPSVTAPEGFLTEIFDIYPFKHFSPDAIYVTKSMIPKLPIYVKLEQDNYADYDDTNLIITDISPVDEVILGEKLADRQPVHYVFSELDTLNYSAWIYAPNVLENRLLAIISISSPEDLHALISHPELREMLRLKLELDFRCTRQEIKRVFMAGEFHFIREAWKGMNLEQRTSFVKSLGVQTNAEIISQFLIRNAAMSDDQVSIDTTANHLLQINEFKKLMGDHEDCFFQSTNISEDALKRIAQKSLQTPADFNNFFSIERKLTPQEQFNNFYRLKQYNARLAFDLTVYSLEHSVDLFNQLPEQIIADLDHVPKFERWLRLILMVANPNEMEAQHWFEFRNFIRQQATDFQCRDQYDILIRAEQLVEDIKNLRFKDFPKATLNELIKENKVAQVIVDAFNEKITEIKDKARDGILNLTITELQNLAFNFHECADKKQLDRLKVKLIHQIYCIVNHPLCAEIGLREMNNPSPKLSQLHEVLRQTYERLEQDYQKYLKPFVEQMKSTRWRQFNAARAQLNEESERLNDEDKNTLAIVLSALDKAEIMVFANLEHACYQEIKMQALDNILLNVQRLDQSNKRVSVIIRQINLAVGLLAAEVSDHPSQHSAYASGTRFFSPANQVEVDSVSAPKQLNHNPK